MRYIAGWRKGEKSRRFFIFVAVVLFVRAKAADEAAQEERFISNARQLVFEGKRSGEGYFSPDGKKLIFQSEREAGNPFYQIYMLDLNTGETTRVSPGKGKTTCGFFQPGTDRVLFASTHADPQAVAKQKAELEFRASGKQRRYSWDYDDTFEIYSAKQDGTDLVNLTQFARLRCRRRVLAGREANRVLFAPRRVSAREAFARAARAIRKRPVLVRRHLHHERGRLERPPSDDAPGYDGGPFFSPDGQRIVWRHFEENGVIADVWTMKTRRLGQAARHRFQIDVVGAVLSSERQILHFHVEQTRASKISSCSSSTWRASTSRCG